MRAMTRLAGSQTGGQRNVRFAYAGVAPATARLSVLSGTSALPAPETRDVVVMDNVSSHKVVGVRELIEAAGAELLWNARRILYR